MKRLEKQFVKTLEDMVKYLCKVHKCRPLFLSEFEYMLVVHVKQGVAEDGRTDIKFVGQLALANAKSGPQAAFQGFVEFSWLSETASTKPEDELAGEVLRLKRLPYVESARASASSYLDPHGFGSIACCTVDELTSKVVAPLAQLGCDVENTVTIRLALLSHDRATMPGSNATDRVITGVNTVWGPTTISRTSTRTPAVAKAAPPVNSDDEDFACLPSVLPLPPPARAFRVPRPELLEFVAGELGEHDGEFAFGGDNSDEEPEGYDDDDDDDSASDAEPPKDDHLPEGLLMPFNKDTGTPSMSPWVREQVRAGVIEDDHFLYVRLPSGLSGRMLGRVECVHGISLMLNAICSHENHAAASSGSSRDLRPAARKASCFAVVSATKDFWEKYYDCLCWLRDNDVSREQHKDDASALKAKWKR